MTGPHDTDASPGTALTDAFQVSISDAQKSVPVEEERLRTITQQVLLQEGVTSAEISIALVEDPEIHDVNRRFLAHDYPTDVISFLLNDSDEGSSDTGVTPTRHLDGEVVISVETARRTATEMGGEPVHELVLYLIHGLLHLCGYDDHSEADRQQMRQREQAHLQNAGISANYEC